MDFPFSHHQQGRIDFNTSLPTGKDFLISSVRTFSHHQSFCMEWVRKSFPVDREGLTVLNSILPCWRLENVVIDNMLTSIDWGKVQSFLSDLVQVSLSGFCGRGTLKVVKKVKPEGQLSIFISMRQVNACPTRTGWSQLKRSGNVLQGDASIPPPPLTSVEVENLVNY